MPTNADAIADLEAARETLKGQRATGGASSFTRLLIALQRITDEINALKRNGPETDSYAPRTEAFKSDMLAGQYFAEELASVAAEFASVAAVAPAVEKVRRYIH